MSSEKRQLFPTFFLDLDTEKRYNIFDYAVDYSEVTGINKQRFLKELGGLLTFMSEDDRQEALMLYEKMFDDAEDEQALIQSLISPTRQAVIIARAYDSSLRRRSVSAKAEDPENTPEFIMAILRVYDECVPLPEYTEEEPAPSPAVPETFEPEPPAPAVEPAPVVLTERYETVEPTYEKPEQPEAERPVLFPEDEEEEGEEPAPAPSAPVYPRRETETVRRVKPLILVPFLLFGIPLTLLGVGLLLIPTLLSLLAAAVGVVCGCSGILAAFSGFAMFADFLIVLGCAIISLAVGMLLAWLFVWFIGGAIVGLIRGVISLGRSWCFEEVPV